MTVPSRKDQLLAELGALDEQLARKATANLHEFVRQAWPVVELQRPLVDAWHVGAIAEHLTAVVRGQIQNLGINIPPSTGKSTLVSVLFPAWVWAQTPPPRRKGAPPSRVGPGQRFMSAAFDQAQSTRDNMRMRDLVLSDWYQERWPHVQLRDDQNQQRKYGTTAGGWRMMVAVGAPRMGEHPNYKICCPRGTLVETRTGPQPIEMVREDDTVLAYDHAYKQLGWCAVTRTFRSYATSLVEIVTTRGLISLTNNHPIFVVGRGYTPAETVEPGDEVAYASEVHVRGLRGAVLGPTRARVLSRRAVAHGDGVYNIAVTGTNNYFANGFLVHNCDDPHNPKKQLLSDKEIEQACQWYDFTFKIRGAMLNAPTVLVMQRLHERDLCGHLQATQGSEWHWLVLPMRWEPKRMVQLPTGWKDPRDPESLPVAQVVTQNGITRRELIAKGVGALLWPSEWSAEKCDMTYKPGSWGDAAQFQQRPAPAGGLMFKRDWFRIIYERPHDVVRTVRSWDVAGTEQGTGPRTVGLKMSRCASGLFVIEGVRKGRWSERDVDLTMKQTADLDGADVAIYEEQEPGSAGKAVVAARRRLLAGYSYTPLPPQADKVTRARPLRSQVEGGNVVLLVTLRDAVQASADSWASQVPEWVEEFLAEIEMFPVGTLKDQVDAASQALNVLTVASQSDPVLVVAGAEVLSEADQVIRDVQLREDARREVEDAIARTGVYWPGHESHGTSRYR